MGLEHKYDTVDVNDHDHHSESSTEVEESLIGADDKHWQVEDYHRHQRRTKKSKFWSIFKSSQGVINIGLLLVIIGLLLRDQWRKEEIPKTSEHEVGGDMTGLRPHFTTQVTTFHINQTFAPYNTSEFFSNETWQAWNELMPIGMGFEEVKDPSKYHDLPTPIIWPGKTVFTTSFTHQLHCLFAIVWAYSGMTAGQPLEENYHWHMIHCFDYLRQAIMCSADMALEGLETTFPDHNGGSDGWDSKHVCRDYNQVLHYLEGVRAYDDQQIY